MKTDFITLIDSHAHLDMSAFDKDRDDIISSAADLGLGILSVGIDYESSHKAFQLASDFSHIYSTAGVHPHDLDSVNSKHWKSFEALWQKDKVLAIGEIGLDFYRDYSPRNIQQRVFIKQLEYAEEFTLPVIIHSRNSLEEVKHILKDFPSLSGIFHCFPGNEHDADFFIERNYYISIPGTVTYKKASRLKRVSRHIPLNRLLIETDCPYLTPEPFRGKRNNPLYVRFVAEKIASLRNLEPDEVKRATTLNFRTLFNL